MTVSTRHQGSHSRWTVRALVACAAATSASLPLACAGSAPDGEDDATTFEDGNADDALRKFRDGGRNHDANATANDSGGANTDAASTTDAAPPVVVDASPSGPSPLHYYVATTGNDANDGSAARPWRTIAHADAALALGAGGTIVHFAAGTYVEEPITTRSGTASQRIRFVSDVKWGALMQDASWFAKGDYVDIVGFQFTGASTSMAIGVYGSYSRVLGNFIHDIGSGCHSSGAIVMPPNGYALSHDNEASGNVVRNLSVGTTGCNKYHGVYLAGARMIASNNIVSGVPGWGIHMWHDATRCVITNNVSFNNRQGGVIVGAGDSTSNSVVADYTVVTNNIVVNNGADDKYGFFEYGAVGTSNVYRNNVVYNNQPANFSSLHGAAPTGTITLDATSFAALFVDYRADGTGDYRLRAGSAAIDTGTTACAAAVTSCAPSFDIAGGARPVGAALDVGAYEYGAPAAAWPFYLTR